MKRALLLEPLGPNFDLSSALGWGPVLTLFPAGMPVTATSATFGELLQDRLDSINYNADDDALIIAGKTSKLVRTVSYLEQWYIKPELLYWNDTKQHYQTLVDYA